MAKISQIAGRSGFAVAANVSTFMNITAAAVFTTTVEANVCRTVRTPGTYSNLFARITANTLTGTCTVRFRKNSANGNQSFVINAGATGTFTDASNSDSVVATDLVCLSVVTQAGGTSITFSQLGCAFNGGSLTSSAYWQAQSAFFTANNTRNYLRWAGSAYLNAAETAADQFRIRIPLALRWYQVIATTNARTTTTTVGARLNGADATNITTFGAGVTGLQEDTTHTDSLVSGDLIDRYILGGASGENFNATQSAELISLANQVQYICQGTQSVGASQIRFDHISGNSIMSTTETETLRPLQFPGRAISGQIYLSANTTTNNSTLVLRKNGVDTAFVVTVPAATTGIIEFTATPVDFLETDEISWKWTTGATGSATSEWTSLALTNLSASTFKPKKFLSSTRLLDDELDNLMLGSITMRTPGTTDPATGSRVVDDIWFFRNRRRHR